MLYWPLQKHILLAVDIFIAKFRFVCRLHVKLAHKYKENRDFIADGEHVMVDDASRGRVRIRLTVSDLF